MSAKTQAALPGAKPKRKPARRSSVLLREIERYLAAVECFRSLGCEPHWRA